MKELGINIYFTQSGCLTLKALERYKSSDLDAKYRELIKSHLASCKLCSEAFEGLKLLPDRKNIYKTITGINQNLNEIILNDNEKKQSHKSSGKLFYIYAAASILILFGLLFYLKLLSNKSNPDFSNFDIPKNVEMPLPSASPINVHNVENSGNMQENRIDKTKVFEKLKHIKISISEIDEGDFFDEELEISNDKNEEVSEDKVEKNKPYNKEGILIDMVMVKSEANTKGGPSAPSQFPHFQIKPNSNNRRLNKKEYKQETVFTIVETMPQFPGGETGLRKYLQSNLRYPSKARKEGKEGKVYISFVVNSFGKVTDAIIVKGMGAGCDELALHTIEKMPLWKPATQQGKAVNVRFVIPIYFNLHFN